MAKILVVDDYPDDRKYLVKLLGYSGHQLLEASDGAEALEQVRGERPDLVISDLFMPTMDGFEFVWQLRNDPAIAHTIVVFYTATYQIAQVSDLAKACGVIHVIQKPASPEQILRIVNQVLGLAMSTVPLPPPEQFYPEHKRLVTGKLCEKLDSLGVRLGMLIDFDLELSSQREPRRLLENFCRLARELVGARIAVVFVNGTQTQARDVVLIHGMDEVSAARIMATPPRQGIVATLIAKGRTCRLRDLVPGSGAWPPEFPAAQSFLGAPITSLLHTYGWLGLLDKIGAEEFSEEDERLVGILAAQVGRIYENGSLYAELQERVLDLNREIAERKRAEEMHRETQERLQHVLASSPAVTYVLRIEKENAQPTWISDNMTQMMGYDSQEYLAANWWADRLHPEDRAGELARWSILCREGHLVSEYRFRHKDGSYRWIHDEKKLSRVAAGLPREAIGSWSDVTDRKNLEEQFHQAQKMEAIGNLAGGVAHDFNNLLTVINGYSELVLGQLAVDAPFRTPIREIKKAGERAARLTHQLLAFSRKQMFAPVVLDVNTLVQESERMLCRLIGEDIDLNTVLEPVLGLVKADPGQIEQVIMNLAVNARDAMPTGGKLTIETQNAALDESYAREHPEVHPGHYVLLAVSDTGCGMDPATQARIFEPFFTTKERGKGTGLGLATVFGIVKQSEGFIYVYSEVGQGSTFKIYLPRIEDEPLAKQSQSGIVTVPGGSETILLVEDEDGVRMLIHMALEAKGYEVLEARDGEEALEIAQKHQGAIDLLVTDVVMPKMSGREAADLLAGTRPNLKVLYLSGYTDDAVIRHGILETSTAFLQKPFTPNILARKVREVLDAPQKM